MLLAFLSSFFRGFGSIAGKKTMLYEKNVGNFYFKIIGLIVTTPFVYGIMYFFLDYRFHFSLFSWRIFLLFVANTATNFPITILSQNITRTEKISYLIPFNNLNTVFSIIIAYILFFDTSLTTVFCALGTVLFLLFSNIKKGTKLPKNLKKIFLLHGILSLRTLITVYIIKIITPQDMYVLMNTFFIIFLIIPTFFTTKLASIRELEAPFYSWRIFTSLIFWVCGLIGFILIKDFWVITALLLGFLEIGITLMFGFFLLWDIPSKKSIFQIFIVYTLVGIGFYFR